MPSNPKTTYLNLPLYEPNDSQTKFVDFWQSIALNADGTNNALSAFQLIDAAYHLLDTNLQALDTEVQRISSVVIKEYESRSAFPASGTASTIYVDKSTNILYRWTGTAYTQLSPTTNIEQTIATMQATIAAMPDDIYNRIAQLINDAMGGSY